MLDRLRMSWLPGGGRRLRAARAAGRGGVIVLAWVAIPLLCTTASSGELSKEEGKWAAACLSQLRAESAIVRRGAERALAALGTDAAPILADAWDRGRSAAEVDAAESALLRMGRDAVLRRLRRMRDAARATEARRLDALIAAVETASSADPDGEPPPGPGDARTEQRWAKSCLSRLGANSPRVRTGAERALASLGLGAVPGLAELWVRTSSRVEQAAVRRVLLAIGRDAVAAKLVELRDGKRGVAARRLDELIAHVGGASAPGTSNHYALTPSSTLDWRIVPFMAEHPVADRMPATLGLGNYSTRRAGPALMIDADGDGQPKTRIQPGEARTLAFRTRGTDRPVLVYEKLGHWYASSASLLVGNGGSPTRSLPIELLDGDLDGRFDGERDHIRVGDGAFHHYRKGGVILWGEDRARYELALEENGPVLHVDVLERPKGTSKADWEGLVALNRFRAVHGLAPLGYDSKRSVACRKHAEYLAANIERGRKDLGGTTHDEDPRRPGYTEEGAHAGASSNISGGSDLARTVDGISRTMLHRVAWFCEDTVGAGFGATRRGGGWSVIWTGSAVANGDAPVLVPAPGMHHVPRRGSPEWPPPDRAPRAYENRIGYPVSVTFAPLPYTGVNLELLMADGKTRVPGHTFTPARPLSSTFPRNGGTAFFLPSHQLTAGSRYWAVFTASRAGTSVRFVWTFSVER